MFKKLLSLFLLSCFVLNMAGPMPQVYAQGVAELPVPGAMVNLSPAYVPVLMKGLRVHREDPFKFDFMMDTGHSGLSANDAALKQESDRLIKYFLAALTVPEKDLWVNLSPYEKDRMIADNLGQTEMGRDMLAQDYILKQLTASLIYPEKELGKAFWDKVYAKAQQLYGSNQVPVNTFNKVWIVAERADIFEHKDTVYVVGAHLKVMLEEDYLALQKHGAAPSNGTGAIGANIVREIILPELEKEVNEGKNFAPLRQMFYAMILATWYKTALKDAVLTQVYGDQSKVKAGVNVDDPAEKEKIYERYLQAYKKGVFNYIKEDIDAVSQQLMPKKYFSGGLLVAPSAAMQSVSRAEATRKLKPVGDAVVVAGRANTAVLPASAAMATKKNIRAREVTKRFLREVETAITSFEQTLQARPSVRAALPMREEEVDADTVLLRKKLNVDGLSTPYLREIEDRSSVPSRVLLQFIAELAGQGKIIPGADILNGFITTITEEGLQANLGDASKELMSLGFMQVPLGKEKVQRPDQINFAFGGTKNLYRITSQQFIRFLAALLIKDRRLFNNFIVNGATISLIGENGQKKRKDVHLVKADTLGFALSPRALTARGYELREALKEYFIISQGQQVSRIKITSASDSDVRNLWINGKPNGVFLAQEVAALYKDILFVTDSSNKSNGTVRAFKVGPDNVSLLEMALTTEESQAIFPNGLPRLVEGKSNESIVDGDIWIIKNEAPMGTDALNGVQYSVNLEALYQVLVKTIPAVGEGQVEGTTRLAQTARSISQKMPVGGANEAMVANKISTTNEIRAVTNGGIDFNKDNMQMNVQKQDGGVDIKFDAAMITRIKQNGFDGIEFKIETIVPITNLPFLFLE